MRHRFGLGMPVGRCAGEGHALHDRQVGPVIAHGGRLRPSQPQGVEKFFGSGALVFCAKPRVDDAQGLEAQTQCRRVPASDHHRCDAGLLQQLQALSVERVEALEGFASFFGPDFYSLPRNTKKITLVKQAQSIPAELPLGDATIVPLRAGETIAWTLA